MSTIVVSINLRLYILLSLCTRGLSRNKDMF
jgi:hypothetical protein